MCCGACCRHAYAACRAQIGEYDIHEFAEILNAGNSAVNMANFRFVSAKGEARFTVPGTSVDLAPGAYAIFAKVRRLVRSKCALTRRRAQDPAAFSAQYPANTAAVYGPFTGELSNGGDKLALLVSDGARGRARVCVCVTKLVCCWQSDNGHVIDSVFYDDKFPWPLGADGLGIDNDMLEYTGDPPPPDYADWGGTTYSQFRFTGLSLQLYVGRARASAAVIGFSAGVTTLLATTAITWAAGMWQSQRRCGVASRAATHATNAADAGLAAGQL